ncbi:ferredoxin-NADPH reductase [Phytoactinopolyspora alkaliphila]|uniref:Ferredoxin-NADPH reductase n=1 Tax=Phytoactinopolyspora alkaliphila TaxID=1783498 RepID=A0A6N9YIV7_9ACTN|nr:ferredoxin-NADPH reductase [Phytoactinopolyspora alkaliphila]NED94894.1 ferredoxin-NADPH reductase [Phytoactinopolyspora alkaliphila]
MGTTAGAQRYSGEHGAWQGRTWDSGDEPDGTDTRGGVVHALMRPAAQSTYENIFGTVYVGLMVNLLLAATCSPLLVALAIVRDPVASWPFFLALSAVCAPALAGAFGCFRELSDGGGSTVLRPFWTAYRSAARRALGVWVAGSAIVTALLVDGVVLARTAWGGALVPFFVTTSLLVVAVVVGVVVMVVERPDARLRDLVRPSIYLLARRWYLVAMNLAVLALAVGIALLKPAIGLLVVCSPLLYVVWANTRYMLNPPATPPVFADGVRR